MVSFSWYGSNFAGCGCVRVIGKAMLCGGGGGGSRVGLALPYLVVGSLGSAGSPSVCPALWLRGKLGIRDGYRRARNVPGLCGAGLSGLKSRAFRIQFIHYRFNQTGFIQFRITFEP